MGEEWQSTDHLVLDVDGHLFERYRGGYHWRGPIEDADVPEGLERERDELLDLWRDSARDDPRAEALATFHRDLTRRP